MNVSQGFRLREFKMRLQIFITWRQASLQSGARQDLNLQKGNRRFCNNSSGTCVDVAVFLWLSVTISREPLCSRAQCCGTIQLCQQAALFKARLFFSPCYRCYEYFILRTGPTKKKEKIPVLSYQRHPSFTGKNNSDLIISVRHVPAGPCGQTSSVHKWQNNGERNYKTLSSRAIKSSTRIWDVSPLPGEGSIRFPWMRCSGPVLAIGTVKSLWGGQCW